MQLAFANTASAYFIVLRTKQQWFVIKMNIVFILPEFGIRKVIKGCITEKKVVS